MSATRELMQDRRFMGAKAVIDLLLAYVFGSFALNSGSYWHYLFAIGFLVFGITFSVRTLKYRGKE